MFEAKINLREVGLTDISLLFHWANDPAVRSASFNSMPISESEHFEWFNKKIVSAQSKIYILEVDDQPAGQIRFDESDLPNSYEIDFSIGGFFRRKGLGAILLNLGIKAHAELHRGKKTYIGRVKNNNTASQRSFIASGFSPSEEFNDCIIYRKHVSEK